MQKGGDVDGVLKGVDGGGVCRKVVMVMVCTERC